MAMASTTRFLIMTRRFPVPEACSALLLVVSRICGARSLALGGSLLLGVAGNLEEVEHAQIGFVTRVLDQLPFGGPHGQQHRPRFLPRGRVADRQPQLEPALVHTRVTFGQMQTGR